MRRLYLRIYLAVLVSIALSVALAGLAWRFAAGPENFMPRQQFVQAVAERMLPPANATPAQMRESLERWQQLSGFDFALVAPDGRLLASLRACACVRARTHTCCTHTHLLGMGVRTVWGAVRGTVRGTVQGVL